MPTKKAASARAELSAAKGAIKWLQTHRRLEVRAGFVTSMGVVEAICDLGTATQKGRIAPNS